MIIDPKLDELTMSRLKWGKTSWRAEPVLVEMISDDLWLELKLQPNLEIAGSPRYSCRTSARVKNSGVEH